MTARVFVISPSNSRLRETMPFSSDFRREGNTIPTMTVCKENRAGLTLSGQLPKSKN
jgi:hypothetical protein